MMSYVLINPGSRASTRIQGLRRTADSNMRALCRELGIVPRFERDGDLEHDGWYGYLLRVGCRVASVDMPGCALDVLKEESYFAPRLYVEGNSWHWPFALNVLRDHFGFARIAA